MKKRLEKMITFIMTSDDLKTMSAEELSEWQNELIEYARMVELAHTPNKKEVDLKPCPFCGGVAKLRERQKAYSHAIQGQTRKTFVECVDCNAMSKWFKQTNNTLNEMKTYAIQSWNRRAGEEDA